MVVVVEDGGCVVVAATVVVVAASVVVGPDSVLQPPTKPSNIAVPTKAARRILSMVGERTAPQLLAKVTRR